MSNQLSSHNNPSPAIHEDLALGAVPRAPLRQHVQHAVEQYFIELEGQTPTNLYQTILQEVEKPLLEVVLAQTDGNQSKTALILGLNRGTLRKKMQLYGLM
ncbi:helix-turn-helix domain-containing protein [Psychrobacter sp. FDAARGOS_221]|uniref:helix-turn-helix domain-containing protein n=1 Tax=Psychrobacter sp. FDAARGOS_221 TaxID=1975705 RepID=UPI000BB54399|nr:helix-turn-helix domain-containing protein [Psychrobacter sp. FDAARGOS_221]PNK59978.1 Fis family transcriptional regulator [Psychrobacter sp. FDAARGOS_221]